MKSLKGEFDILIKHKNTEEASRLFNCDRIEYIAHKKGDHFDHHLMFCRGKELIFKVWLRNEPHDIPYKNIKEAMKDVGIDVHSFAYLRNKVEKIPKGYYKDSHGSIQKKPKWTETYAEGKDPFDVIKL